MYPNRALVILLVGAALMLAGCEQEPNLEMLEENPPSQVRPALKAMTASVDGELAALRDDVATRFSETVEDLQQTSDSSIMQRIDQAQDSLHGRVGRMQETEQRKTAIRDEVDARIATLRKDITQHLRLASDRLVNDHRTVAVGFDKSAQQLITSLQDLAEQYTDNEVKAFVDKGTREIRKWRKSCEDQIDSAIGQLNEKWKPVNDKANGVVEDRLAKITTWLDSGAPDAGQPDREAGPSN